MAEMFNPRQTVLISCQGASSILGRSSDVQDVFPLDWHSPASYEPPRYAIFVNKNITAVSLISGSRAFAVNFMPFVMKDRVVAAGKHSPKEDKWKAARLTPVDCDKLLDCPRVKEALGWLECEVEQELDLGDTVLFIGKVIFSDMPKNDKRLFHIDGEDYTTTRE
jgi:flavin reductase (DIM6/NTAB) family NADH-FMN oxidoreductase RutF